MYIIYKTTCLVNNKEYIGQRKIVNKNSLDEYYIGSGSIFLRFVKGLGKDKFKRKVLCIIKSNDVSKVNSLEKFFIEKYNTIWPNGFNIIPGAACEVNPGSNLKIRKKISNSLKGRFSGDKNPFFGKKHTEETREKIRRERKFQIITEETKAKMRLSQKGKRWANNGIVNTLIKESEGLPSGFNYGRIKYKRAL